jgi:hypothetical protein
MLEEAQSNSTAQLTGTMNSLGHSWNVCAEQNRKLLRKIETLSDSLNTALVNRNAKKGVWRLVFWALLACHAVSAIDGLFRFFS